MPCIPQLTNRDPIRVVETRRLVTSVRRALNPYAECAEVLAVTRLRELRFVLSNTTEAGIVYEEEPWTAECPEKFPAKVTALLAERYRAWNGAVLICFYRPLPCQSGEWRGCCDGVEYPIGEETEVLTFFAQSWRQFQQLHDPGELARAILAHAPFWGCDLNEFSGLTQTVARGIRAITTHGARTALQEIITKTN